MPTVLITIRGPPLSYLNCLVQWKTKAHRCPGCCISEIQSHMFASLWRHWTFHGSMEIPIIVIYFVCRMQLTVMEDTFYVKVIHWLHLDHDHVEIPSNRLACTRIKLEWQWQSIALLLPGFEVTEPLAYYLSSTFSQQGPLASAIATMCLLLLDDAGLLSGGHIKYCKLISI